VMRACQQHKNQIITLSLSHYLDRYDPGWRVKMPDSIECANCLDKGWIMDGGVKCPCSDCAGIKS
jgi:hypothetical protein